MPEDELVQQYDLFVAYCERKNAAQEQAIEDAKRSAKR